MKLKLLLLPGLHHTHVCLPGARCRQRLLLVEAVDHGLRRGQVIEILESGKGIDDQSFPQYFMVVKTFKFLHGGEPRELVMPSVPRAPAGLPQYVSCSLVVSLRMFKFLNSFCRRFQLAQASEWDPTWQEFQTLFPSSEVWKRAAMELQYKGFSESELYGA